MLTRMQCWWLLATVPFLVGFFPGPAACQEVRGTPLRGEATQFDYSKSHSFPNVFSPYIAPIVPEPRLDTSRRLQNLIVDGKLNLTLDDAIALALENNMDIAAARYVPIAQTDSLRAKGTPRPLAWQAHISPAPFIPAVWAEVWAAAQSAAALAEGEFWEAELTPRVHRAAVIRIYSPQMAGATLLDRHNIALSEAIDGDVHRAPNIPGTHEPEK